MANSSSETATVETVRCKVCGREFESQDAREQHIRNEGLLW